MEVLFDPLMQYGALGLFCIFLITQYIIQNRKIDAQNEKFTKSLESLRESHLEREEALRAEYLAQNNLLRTENESLRQNHAEVFSQFRQHVINAHGYHKENLGVIKKLIDTIIDDNRNWRQGELLRRAKEGKEV